MLKWIGITIATLVALALAAAVTLSLLFDPNDYKGSVQRWVEQRTGRELTIQGDLQLSFLPWLGVATGRLELGNAAGFQQSPFATVERANVRVKLLPLLARRFEIGTVELDGLILNLARDLDGRGNWEDLLDSGPTEQTGSAPAGDASPFLESVQVAGLRLGSATIYWREQVDEVRYIVRDLSLTLGQLQPDEPVDMTLAANLLSVEPQFNLQVGGTGIARIDAALDAFTATDLALEFSLQDGRDSTRAVGRLTADATGSIKQRTLSLAGGQLTATLIDPPGKLTEDLELIARWPTGDIDLVSETLNFAALSTTVNGMRADWGFQVEQLLSEPRANGSVTAEAVPWEQVINLAALDLPDGVEGRNLGSLDLSSSFSYQAPAELSLRDTRINTLGFAAVVAATIDGDRRLASRVTVPSFDARQLIQAIGPALPESVDASAIKRLAFAGSIQTDTDSGDVLLPDFNVQLLGATLTGSLRVSEESGHSEYSGTFQAPQFDGAEVAQAFARLLPANLDSRELGPLGINTRFGYRAGSDELRLDDLTLQTLGLTSTGSLVARSFSKAPTWTGRLTTAPFSPRDLMTRFGQEVPVTADKRALTRATVAGTLSVTATGGQFRSLRLNLDDSVISGEFSVDDYDDPRYAFDLAIDSIDVDRYLPPGAEPGADVTQGVTTDQVKVPTQTLDTLNLDGQVVVGGMQLAGLTFADVATRVMTGGGSARLDSARAKLYGGAFDGSLQVSTQGKVPSISLKGSATNIQLEPLLVALRGESSVSGSGSFQLDLSGRGETVLENVQSAAGNVEFALRDGTVKGFNLGHTLCRAYNAQKKLPAPRGSVPSSTQFTLMQGAATVQKGIANSRNLEATSSFLAVSGSGGLDLANQGLNYDMTAKLTGSIAIDGCESMDGVIGQSIPFTVRGTIGEPKIAPDFGKLLQQTIRRRVEDEIRDKLLERLGLPRPGEGGSGDRSGEAPTPR